MPGRQAKILSKDNADDLLVFASTTRFPVRDRLIVLLSTKAGLRAAEIANLTWEMVLTHLPRSAQQSSCMTGPPKNLAGG
jgi:integrase/recombinase XerD